MDRHTDDQHETIIPRHYCVAGYKNAKQIAKNEDPDQTSHYAESDLGLHCWQLPFLGFPD